MTENKITRNKLCNILQTNADLPILALVDCEVVEDDWYQTWFGDVTDVYIDRVWAGKEKTYFIDEALGNMEYFMRHEFLENELLRTYTNDTDIDEWMEYVEKFIKGLPWKKVIIVQVSTPDSLQVGEENEDV